MTESIVFYAKELSIQMGGGIAVGSAVNAFFPQHSKERTMNAPAKVLFEVLTQALVAGGVSVFFISFLRGRGFDPQTTAIGLSPFWIYFIGSQSKMTRKTSALIEYAKAKLESVDPEIGKDIKKLENEAKKF